jgi:anti-sigma factor ChrR (cupin superfamily)
MTERLPELHTGPAGSPITKEDLTFAPLRLDGRVGAETHALYTNAETGGPAAAIVRYLPGANAPAHRHPSFEMIYVISGELETDDGVYGENSVLVMRPGSTHSPRSEKGCLCLVVWERPVEKL